MIAIPEMYNPGILYRPSVIDSQFRMALPTHDLKSRRNYMPFATVNLAANPYRRGRRKIVAVKRMAFRRTLVWGAASNLSRSFANLNP